jgi:nitrile hydratase
MGNDAYLSTSYYEHWLHSVVQILMGCGDLAPGELDAAVDGGVVPTERRDDPDAAAIVPHLLIAPKPEGRAAPPSGRFGPGDRVRVARFVTSEHNRVPRYVRGVTGVVESVSGEEPLMEGIDAGDPQPLYTVAFASQDLWGAEAEPTGELLIDLFEQYLEPA